MSDFLSNLAARSLGDAASIRPRALSLYEPDRRRNGQFGSRLAAQSFDLDAERQTDLLDAPPIPGSPQDAAPSMPRQPESVPKSQNLPEPITTTQPERPSGAWLSGSTPRENPLPEAPATSSEPIRQATNVPAAETHPSPSPTIRAPASLIQPDHPPQGLSRSMPALEPTTGDRELAGPLRGLVPGLPVESTATAFANPDKEKPPATTRLQPVASAPAPSSPQSGSTLRPLTVSATFPTAALKADLRLPSPAIGARLGSIERTNTPRGESAAPPVVSNPRPLELLGPPRPESALSPAPVANLALSPRPAAPAPPLVPRLANDAPAEPSIRITIGRVEVKAVFPPALASRTPPQRSRPTLSLDEYLKRNSGAGR
jgi:hypothetical protein